MVRLVENLTGRPGLIARAVGYESEVAAGGDFWEVMAARYGLSLEVLGGSLANIPRSGPLVVIANHPYGILDGLMLGRILARTRSDFRILANSVFRKAEALDRIVLPVSFDDSRDGAQTNLGTRRQALEFLAAGGAVGVFPGGTVSTAARPFGPPMDPAWRSFTAKMIARSGAAVVPVYFDGHNSRLFQLASHLHLTLRLALLTREFRAQVGKPVRVVVGDPIEPGRLAAFGHDPKGMMAFLRRATYELSPGPLRSYGYGYDFDPKYRA